VVQEQGTVEGTATESMTGQQGANTTGQLQQETEPTTGAVDVDVDTGERAEGAVDVDVTTTPDADTDASGSGVQTTTTTDTLDDDAALPATASDLPTVALMGLLALGAAFVLRLARRNA
jgi:MYXO-CTERM domain-containing protein